MKFFTTIILRKEKVFEDTYLIYLKRPHNFPAFLPGQFSYLINPSYEDKKPHPFSIASSPFQREYLEFCIKTYGMWTHTFVDKRQKEQVLISSPLGKFVWNKNIRYGVFLLGGIGISPIMSILRFISQIEKKPQYITILYGNRTPETIAYKVELEELSKKLPLHIVHIFSHITATSLWKGYRGFITANIIRKEIKWSEKPEFFVIGPPIFVAKVEKILNSLTVAEFHIRKEVVDISTSQQFLLQ